MSMKYCLSCKRNVNTESSINWVVAILLLIFLIIPGIIYIIWKAAKGKRCPICKTSRKYLEAPRFDEQNRMP